MQCEICGEKKAEGKASVDGMELAVCGQCKKFGTEVSKPTRTQSSGRKEVPGDDLVPGYGARVRRAREKKGLSLEDLGKELMEKSTVLHKVERGEMLPDDRLVRKIEKFFGIKLRGSSGVGAVDYHSRKLPEATLGDLAEIKVKK